MSSGRLVPIPHPERELDASELKAVFAGLSRDNEVWLAMNQILRTYIVMVATDVADPASAIQHGMLAHSAGGMEWLGRFQADIEERYRQTHTDSLE
jgi:hypothetical protein